MICLDTFQKALIFQFGLNLIAMQLKWLDKDWSKCNCTLTKGTKVPRPAVFKQEANIRKVNKINPKWSFHERAYKSPGQDFESVSL